ncbi:MAG TPA: hypothetical protein VEZ90_11855, partial [Blastocatellia bacterium]|nr:hypothetical protein [Blastocatellia bacterium]
TSSPYKGILANGRMDFKLTDKHTAFVRYSHDDNNVFGPDTDNSLASNWRQNSSNDDNLQAGVTSILTSNVVNDVRFNFQRIINNEDVPTATQCPPTTLGCLGLGGPEIEINNSNFRAGNSQNAFQARDLHRYETADNLSWQKGAHRLKFGGEWEHNYGTGHWAFLNPALLVLHSPNDVIGVDRAIQASALLPAPVKALLNIPIASGFLTGGPISLTDILNLPIITAVVGLGDPSQPPPFQTDIARQSNRYRAYAQDSWLIRPGLTFSYGVSYTNETNLENYDLPKPGLLAPILGSTGKPNKDHDDFAPSLGFAWDIGNKGKTVIRGGAGMYYDTVLFVTRLQERSTIGPAGNGRSEIFGNYFQNNIAFPQIPGLGLLSLINPPLGASIFFNKIPTKFTGADFNNLLNAQSPLILAGLQAAGAAGFTGVDFLKTGTGVLDPNLQVPYSLQYSIGVQRQLPNNMVLSADFVLRKQVHQLIQTDENFFNSAAGPVIPQCVGAAAINPAAQCSNSTIQVVQSSDRSTYKALLVRLEKRFSNRYEFTASYALSSLTGYDFTDGSGTTRPVDLRNWFGSNFNLGADARHRFTFSGVVNLPKGFQGSIIATFASRPPFSALQGGNVLDPNGGAGDPIPGTTANALGRGISKAQLIGIVGPGVLPEQFSFGDNFQSEDIRLTKTFTFRKESLRLQFFAECFNIFNIANLTFDTSSEIVGPNFGQPTGRAGQAFGTGGPRAFQFGARFSF